MYNNDIIENTIKATNLNFNPSLKDIPAAFDAIIVENGFTVENIHPTAEPRNIVAIGTNGSKLFIKNNGIKIE